MSYVASGERVFSYQDPSYPNCTLPAARRSDHRLKRFQSTFDKRAWNLCEEVRNKHFRDLLSGSRTCLGVDQCHRYVPLEDLIKILMAQKDDMIRNLQGQLQQGDPNQELQSQTAGLKEELNKSRDMLRKAMHKLENIDEIVNENKKLQCRLRCSEERVKYLEDKKKNLESELADLRSKSQIQMDLEKAQQMLCQINREKSTEMDEAILQCLSVERDALQEKVRKLEKELEESKKKEAEIEILKKQSQSDSLDKEEMSRENECYKRKLASMKCLEKQIQELKKQGKALADKYKREAQKAAEQMNKMCMAAKELQGLRDERDSLRKRVNELASYECLYNKLQRKLQRVDAVIAENETLNCKLLALQKLEKENEYLKCRLEAIQEMEINAAEDKERIMQLQCAVADQEEEMKDLLCQIERLTSGKNEEELERLKCELYEKNSKLKLCEEQLAEIPMLEAEIDELRMKLQCCCKEFPENKRSQSGYQKVQVRLPASSTGIYANYKSPGKKCSSVIGIRREERVELNNKHASCQEIPQATTERVCNATTEISKKKDIMSCDEVQSLLQSSKGIISCVLEDMKEHQKEMEDLETCNKAMKEEIETLKAKVGGSDRDCLLQEINNLKRAVEEKDLQISKLKQSAIDTENGDDVKAIKELNRQMKVELEAACEGLKQVANLEKMLQKQHESAEEYKAVKRPLDVEQAEQVVHAAQVKQLEHDELAEEEEKEDSPKRSKEVVNGAGFESCKALQKETDDLKLQIEALNKLTEELKKENELLRELQQPCPDFSKELDEKCALENLLSLLQAELDAFKGQKLSDECEALRKELKRVMEQNCQLKALVDCYRQRLDLEKESNELTLKKELGGVEGAGGKEISDCLKELEQLRKEKNEMAEKLQATTGTGPGTGLGTEAVVGATGKDTSDCLKELEQLRKEKNDLLQKLEAGGGKDMSDCLKELEQLRKEKNEMAEKLQATTGTGPGTGPGTEAGVGAMGKDMSDCLKELEQLRKEKNDFMQKLEAGGGKDMSDCLKELEQLRKEKNEMAEKLQATTGTGLGAEAGVGATGKDTSDCLKELEQLRKEKNDLLQKLEAGGGGGGGGKDMSDCLKELEQLRKEKNDLLQKLEAGGGVGGKDMSDCLKELEQLRKEKNEMAEKLQATTGTGPGTGLGAQAGIGAMGKDMSDCLKELEQLKKEKNDLMQKLEAGGGGGGGKDMSDCLKELEQLKKEKNDMAEKLKAAGAGAGAGGKDMSDCLKELEQLKKEKDDMAKQLKEAKAQAEAQEHTDLLKQLEDLKREKNELGTQLAAAKQSPFTSKEQPEKSVDDCEEKLKKLMDQHEKELADREKTYNDNLNAMKAGYETDIRKLAERHKQSITKLQELHEGELQDVNTNYEKQLEQSQTAMKDLAKSSAATARELQKKFSATLNGKEDEFLEKLGMLQNSLNKSREELDGLKKKMTPASTGSIDKLKAQHNREMQKARRASQQKLDSMKKKLEEERKKSAGEIESLKTQLKEQEKREEVCECKFSKKKPPKPRDPSCPLDFNEVLEKILEEGLDCLTFNEIALVHRKTCCALEGIVMNSNENTILELEPPVGDGCVHTPLLEADKQQLLGKIFALENDIIEKQKETQETIISMELAIKKERCRLQEVRNTLQNEQQKNSELKLLLSSHTKFQADLKKERDRLGNQASFHQSLCQEKSKRLDEEMKTKKYLEGEVERLRNTLRHLSMALNAQRGNPECVRVEPVEMMRAKLEQSAHQERKLALQLEKETKCRMQLQCQLQSLRQSLKHMVNLPAVETISGFSQNPLEAKSAKERQNLDQLNEKKNKIKSKSVKKPKK